MFTEVHKNQNFIEGYLWFQDHDSSHFLTQCDMGSVFEYPNQRYRHFFHNSYLSSGTAENCTACQAGGDTDKCPAATNFIPQQKHDSSTTAHLRFISAIATRKKKKKRTTGGQILGQSCQSLTTAVNTAVSLCPKSLRQHRNIRHGHQSPKRGRILRHQRHRCHTVFPARILHIFQGANI